MKISDSIETTSGMHVFETPEDLIINSQVYDKFSMEPKPYNFFNIQTLANKNLLLYEINILEYDLCNPSKEPNYKYYIQDNQEPSTFYCLLEIGKADPNQYFHKIQKVNNNYKLIKSISPNSGYKSGNDIFTSVLHYKILGQTKDYIILTQKCGYGESTARGTYFYSISVDIPAKAANALIAVKKSDLSVKFLQMTTVYDNHIQKIRESNDYVCVYENINGKKIQIIKYFPETNTIQTLFSKNYIGDNPDTTSYEYWKSPISNIINFENNDYYVLFVAQKIDAFFIKLTIDFDNNTVSDTKYVIQNSLIPKIEGNMKLNYFQNNFLRFTLSKINNYINVTLNNAVNINGNYYHTYGNYTYAAYGVAYGYTVDVDDTIASNNGYHRHYLCKFENNKWKSITKIEPSIPTQHIYGVLYLNEYITIFYLTTGIQIYKLNLETENYTNVFEVTGTFQTIGIDENNNFYTFDANNKCQIYNLNSCSTINGAFEQDSYEYDGEEIETLVTIASKNFIGELIASKIHVELSGNCQFRNGNQEAILTTRLDTEYQVPVIITGPGIVYCNINEVE